MDRFEEQQDLFREERQLVPAAHAKRLVNYLVDSLTSALLILIAFAVYRAASPAAADRLMASLQTSFSGNLLVSFLYAFLMSVQESLFRGKSLGKMLTRTRAVAEDGTLLPTNTIFLRNLIRMVPFDSLSALGTPARPWHDRWSRTLVIDEEKSRL